MAPENAVGIGGAYMCIYGMEGPGGYQLFGRTIQMWNSWRQTPVFEPDKPWLLRCFDQIRFFPVSAAELQEARAAFPHGAYPLAIEPARFSYADYKSFLKRENAGIEAFKMRQQTAFEAERKCWREAHIGEAPVIDTVAALEGDLPVGCVGAFSDVPGNIWKILAGEGACVEARDPLVLVESMKMEIAILATVRGVVHSVLVKPGQTVRAGDLVMALEET
jgi:urea carboxylase